MFLYKVRFNSNAGIVSNTSIIVRASTPKEASQWVIENYLTDEFCMKCVRN